MHGGSSKKGAEHPSFKHGAYSDHFRSDLTEREREAYDELVEALEDDETGIRVIEEIASEALLKYKRSNDPRFLREARQLLSKFNILDATENVEVEHSGNVDQSVDVSITHHRVTEEDTDD